ncbi:MAG TPA: flagellar export chaperone FliS [Firmicutes bacterium]|nr:flagellar export chaperone FliS [Bacillota bacterium]
MLNAAYGGGREKALKAYRLSRVETASPGELVLMLYNGSLKNMNDALSCIDEKNYAGANTNLLRAQDIIDELRGALNIDIGNVAKGLDAIYDFVYSSLLKANLKKDTEPLEGALKVMTEVRDAWEEAIRNYG